VGKGAVISYEWKVRASGDFFRMLLFVDLEFGYPYNMIVLQGQFHGLAKGDNSRRDWSGLLAKRKAVAQGQDDGH
jgi:hypothetical protein